MSEVPKILVSVVIITGGTRQAGNASRWKAENECLDCM